MKRKALLSFVPLATALLANAQTAKLWEAEHWPGIFVEASIGDSLKGVFMLDTGATDNGLVLDSVSFARLDTASFTRLPQTMRMAFYRVEYKGNVNIVVGDGTPLMFKDTKVLVVNEARLPTRHLTKDFDVVGIIGYPFFDDRIVSVDFETNTLCFLDTIPVDEGYAAIRLTKGEKGLRLMDARGFTPAEGQKLSASVVFDTGNLWGIILKKELAAKLPLGSTEVQKSGLSEYVRWRADSLAVGPFTLNNVPLRYDRNGVGKEYSMNQGDGLMGMAVMKRFNLIIDFRHDVLYIKPNHYFKKKNKTSK
ncbi:MAG: hypothetical protein IKP91_01195 [Bacteroidaceae bacterium]|nr:hypothetical protein [Bacteroidaceae bacterium]